MKARTVSVLSEFYVGYLEIYVVKQYFFVLLYWTDCIKVKQSLVEYLFSIYNNYLIQFIKIEIDRWII